MRLAGSTLCGVFFGVAAEKCRVHEVFVIQDQMLFDRFVMLKMFLSATATSMLSFSILLMVPATNHAMMAAFNSYSPCLFNKGTLSCAMGGWILGCGMTIAGSCPGMVFAQVGSGTQNAGFTILGGLFGVLLYAALEKTLTALTKPSVPWRKFFLHEHMGGAFSGLALPVVAVLGTMVFAVELYAPWSTEVTTGGGDQILSQLSWPPYVCGAMVGLLQIPIVLLYHDTLGSASSYCTIVAQAFHGRSPYLAKYRSGEGNWWQVFYVSGVIGGAYLSSVSSGAFGKIVGVSPLQSFAGGVLMLFGARLAGGCTSGHGLSGMGLLSMLSFVTVPAMFAGGIATAAYMKFAGFFGSAV